MRKFYFTSVFSLSIFNRLSNNLQNTIFACVCTCRNMKKFVCVNLLKFNGLHLLSNKAIFLNSKSIWNYFLFQALRISNLWHVIKKSVVLCRIVCIVIIWTSFMFIFNWFLSSFVKSDFINKNDISTSSSSKFLKKVFLEYSFCCTYSNFQFLIVSCINLFPSFFSV